MLKPTKLRPMPREPGPRTPKAQILDALAYLASNCAVPDCHDILQLSLDLCMKCDAHEEEGDFFSKAMPFTPTSGGLSAALAYLGSEAHRNKMGDFETIIDATRIFVDYYLMNNWCERLPLFLEYQTQRRMRGS